MIQIRSVGQRRMVVAFAWFVTPAWRNREFVTMGPAASLACTPSVVAVCRLMDENCVETGLRCPALVARIAKRYQDQGWPATVSDDGISLTAEYSAPSAGSPPYFSYQVAPETVFALGTAEPYGATSFRF